MDDHVISTHFENIDRRLARVEQFLPTLATKAELQTAVAPLATKAELQTAVAPLATKQELQMAVAPFATKEELRGAFTSLDTKMEDFRRHMHVMFEAVRGDIQLLAEHLAAVMSRREQ
jgi:hypothetical protein